MKLVHIKEVWWTAGKKFHWMGSPTGIGLKMSDLINQQSLMISIADNDKPYFLNCEIGLDYVAKHNTFWNTKSGMKLGIIPLTLLKNEGVRTLKKWVA